MAKDLVAVERRALTPAQFGDLADVPPELEWLANITNPKTRKAYKIDVSEFSAFQASAHLRNCARSRGRMSSPGARISRPAGCRHPASGTSSRRSPPCSIISASAG
jgi:hypothetical protein